MASVIVTNITATTVSAMITGLSGLSSDYSNPRINCSNGATIYSMSGTFYGLTAETTYGFDAWVFYRDSSDPLDQGADYYISGQYATTLKQRPYNFSWYSSKVSGSDCYVSALEWRAFCSRVNEFRYYKNLSNYSFTYVYGVSEVGQASATSISASIFNEAIYALQPMTSVMSPISSGSYIYASYFNSLVSSLNSIS